MDAHVRSKKHKHHVKMADVQQQRGGGACGAESSQFKLIVTFLKSEAAVNSEEKKESLVALKKVAGLPFAEAAKFLSTNIALLQQEGSGGSCDIVLELRNPPMQPTTDIDRGNFDTAWLQLRTTSAAAVPSDL